MRHIKGCSYFQGRSHWNVLIVLFVHIPVEGTPCQSKRSTRDTLHWFLGRKGTRPHEPPCPPLPSRSQRKAEANLGRKLNNADTVPWYLLGMLAPTNFCPMQPQARVLDPCG